MGSDTKFDNLNDINHSVWKRFMKALLVKRGLWEVVDGTETLPVGSPNSRPVQAFRRRQAEATAEMILHVEVNQLSFMTSDDPAKVWEALDNVHQARGVATRVTTRRKFWKCEKKSDQSVQSFVAEVRKLALDLADVGVTVDDEDIILVITGGLPPSYDNFVITLDSTPTSDLTLDYVVTRLLNEEARQSGSSTTSRREAAFAAVVGPSPPTWKSRRPISEITCFNCRERGHYQLNCPKKKPDEVVAASADADDIW